jgi:hypothetical protein
MVTSTLPTHTINRAELTATDLGVELGLDPRPLIRHCMSPPIHP